MNEFGPTILRIVLGATYIMHAYLSLVVLTPAGMANMIGTVFGLPAPALVAWLVILAHGVGGLMLVAGLWTRAAAAANALIMLGALVKIHLHEGFFLKGVIVNAATGQARVAGYEYALVLLGATVAQILLGSGVGGITRSK